jgi:peptidoglycan-associated lipoprotein
MHERRQRACVRVAASGTSADVVLPCPNSRRIELSLRVVTRTAKRARARPFTDLGGVMRKLFYAAFLAAVLAGCSSTPTQDQGAPVEDKSGATGSSSGANTSGAGTGGVTGSATGTARGSGNPLRDPNSPLSKRSVYFDFDSFTIRDEYKPLIEAHARYLQQNRNARMTIQGNADERGSREYNIALGQKRADAVKRTMTLLGAQDQQIETVSFGKEKPRNSGHDESAWAENRRDDMLYAGE